MFNAITFGLAQSDHLKRLLLYFDPKKPSKYFLMKDTKFYQLVLITFSLLQLEKIGKASANGSVPKSGKPNEKVTEKTSDDRLAR